MIEFFSFTEAGDDHENEDAFAVVPHPADSDCLLGVIADGQGGQRGGRAAARLACQTWVDLASRLKPANLFSGSGPADLLHDVDRAVSDDRAAGFTTCVGWAIRQGWLSGASSGDSALLMIRNGAADILTRRQLKNPPLGSGNAIPVAFGGPLPAPWKLLAMTDGVFKYAGWDAVTRAALGHSGQAIITALADAARLRSGVMADDFTAVVWQSAERATS